MNHVLKNTIILLFVFMAMLSSSIYSNENKWDLEVELDKQDYLLYEPIWLDITLINATSDTLRTHGLRAPNHDQFIIELRDNTGKLVKYTGGHFFIQSSPGRLLLGPDDQDYSSFNLLSLFPSHKENSGYRLLNRIRFVQKGKYTIHVFFEGDISKELKFNILKPRGDEKKALKLIEKASKKWKQKNPDPSAQTFNEIIEKYPNSAYAEQSFYLSRYYSQETREGLKDGSFDKRIFKRELLDNFPNSGYSGGWLKSITHKMDDSAKLEFLDSLQGINPNTRSDKFIKQMRERILKKKAGE